MTAGVFTLNLNDEFRQLSRPPIVEAVIHWQARATNALDPEALDSVLRQQFPQYPIHEPMQRVRVSAELSEREAIDPVVRHSKGWLGIRLKSEDQRYVVQFLRDGLIFSRAKDYENWESFSTGAKEAWKSFLEIANPSEIQRLGVRYINHFATATPTTLGKFLREPPTQPSELPLEEFVYQSTFSVPEHPFGVRVIKIMQPSMPGLQNSSGLFLDIDIFSTKPILNDPELLDDTLVKMRWLKNKVFFTLLTDSVLDSFV